MTPSFLKHLPNYFIELAPSVAYLVDVEPLEDVDCVEVLSQVVSLQTGLAFQQRGGLHQVLVVRVVEALLSPKRNLSLDFL